MVLIRLQLEGACQRSFVRKGVVRFDNYWTVVVFCWIRTVLKNCKLRVHMAPFDSWRSRRDLRDSDILEPKTDQAERTMKNELDCIVLGLGADSLIPSTVTAWDQVGPQ